MPQQGEPETLDKQQALVKILDRIAEELDRLAVEAGALACASDDAYLAEIEATYREGRRTGIHFAESGTSQGDSWLASDARRRAQAGRNACSDLCTKIRALAAGVRKI